jgi:hypothetical protein
MGSRVRSEGRNVLDNAGVRLAKQGQAPLI